MAELRPEAAAVAGLVVIEGFKAFKDTLPPIGEVRKRSQADDGFKAELRAGELLAGTVVLLGATSVTALTGNQAPLVLGLVTVGAMVLLYETTLARPHPAPAVDVEEVQP